MHVQKKKESIGKSTLYEFHQLSKQVEYPILQTIRSIF